MLQILFFILKLLGYILLIVMGILLTVILLVLLVPIRYKVHVEHGERFELDGKVSWLLHIIHGQVLQKHGKRHITLRIFGFLIFDNQRVRSRRKARKGVRKAKKSLQKTVRKKKASELPYRKKRKNTSQTMDDGKKVKNKSDTIDFIENEFEDGIENFDYINKSGSNFQHKQDTENEKVRYNNKEFNEFQQEIIMEEEESFFKSPIKFLKRICFIIRKKVLSFFGKLKSIFLGIIRRIKSILKSLFNIKNKIHIILEFIKNDLNKQGFRLTYRSLKRILKHILPTKLKSTLIFGTGDPCSTGQVLGVFAILYSFYGGDVKITPDFENQRFEGKHYAKGRIRLATLLIIVIKLILDKQFKQFTRNLITLKEAL